MDVSPPRPTTLRRAVTAEDVAGRVPIYAVWEVTLACDLKCVHCGSRAGRRRRDELTTEEALEVVAGLSRLGTREVTLIGGEAYLRPDWLKIIEAITNAGMECGIQSGGRFLNKDRIRSAALAGATVIGISIDGIGATHDRQRGVIGSFEAATKALTEARALGLQAHANSQINSQTVPELEQIFEHLQTLGVSQWLVQLTVAMGRASDRPDLLIQPWQLLDVMPLLAELAVRGRENGPVLHPGNNIGYFGPYETVLRGLGDRDIYWKGCSAGHLVIALEADGTVKGCPSLPTRSYGGRNVREAGLERIWADSEHLDLSAGNRSAHLWGLCSTCRYRHHCAGGCNWTSHSALGRRGNNPFCHYHALRLASAGIRERLVSVESAPGESFDHGRCDLLTEDFDGRLVNGPSYLDDATIPEDATLVECRVCGQYGDETNEYCDFCGGRVLSAEGRRIAAATIADVEKLLQGKQSS